VKEPSAKTKAAGKKKATAKSPKQKAGQLGDWLKHQKAGGHGT